MLLHVLVLQTMEHVNITLIIKLQHISPVKIINASLLFQNLSVDSFKLKSVIVFDNHFNQSTQKCII